MQRERERERERLRKRKKREREVHVDSHNLSQLHSLLPFISPWHYNIESGETTRRLPQFAIEGSSLGGVVQTLRGHTQNLGTKVRISVNLLSGDRPSSWLSGSVAGPTRVSGGLCS